MKTLDTCKAIGTELDTLYVEVDAGGLEPEDARGLNMKLAILKQRADLIRSNEMEQKVEEMERLVRERFGPRRVA
jgi:hypothetical protein